MSETITSRLEERFSLGAFCTPLLGVIFTQKGVRSAAESNVKYLKSTEKPSIAGPFIVSKIKFLNGRDDRI